ncbi:MAG: PQQ-dependent dehydrogenase, methanol/ethanol family [Pseudomonadota bacterium]|jgi:quinohemoprotein ethanol dehydrogenase|nr:MAG: PQQ-dependent dehydrogenase, methanol/ethanol family [Pseudomonadota bacterium]
MGSTRSRAGLVLAVATLAALAACKRAPEAVQPTGRVDAERLANIEAEPGQWLTTGRDAGKTHYSPLDAINRDNVARVGFAWEYRTGTNRGMQATPIVVDGVMYTSGVAGRVYALNAATGELLWEFTPSLKLRNARGSCCDIVNRGVAVWKGKVYVGSFEGILYALDARDGKVLWEVDTIADHQLAYSITGAPQVAGSVVVIGNGGAEFDTRGYVSAYDLDTGELKWRFYTVPTDPAKPQDNPALEMAVKTWDPKRDWGWGGGGNAWDGFAYDAESDLVYFGTANGSPWSPTLRSPAGGDNLFLASILALKASTGEYAWHYQQTPGDQWDYDATPHLMLAELDWNGERRKVLMQASKNGYFYVHDRVTGELLAADEFVDASWSNGVDLATGRPIINPEADYTKGRPVIVFPSGAGGHNFNPMSLSAKTGLVYIPAIHSGMMLAATEPRPRVQGQMSGGFQVSFVTGPVRAEELAPPFKALANPAYLRTLPSLEVHASLKAWDPVARKVVWEHRYPSFNDHGGVLSTAGGLVVQGSIDGHLRFFDDTSGRLLKEIFTGTSIVAAPMSYTVDGVQYIAVLAGTGGGGWTMWTPDKVASRRGNDNRILVFRLDGGEVPVPPELPPPPPIPEPPVQTASAADIAAGAVLFGGYCGSCHSNFVPSPVPDLRRSPLIREASAFASVVRDGALQSRGMPAWDDLLTDEQIEQIRVHLVEVARQAYAAQQAGAGSAGGAAASEGHL